MLDPVEINRIYTRLCEVYLQEMHANSRAVFNVIAAVTALDLSAREMMKHQIAGTDLQGMFDVMSASAVDLGKRMAAEGVRQIVANGSAADAIAKARKS